jgi:hypothetical protein
MDKAIFLYCVEVLEGIGSFTGWGYQLTNIIIFMILNPLIILVFLSLWIREKKKFKAYVNSRMK